MIASNAHIQILPPAIIVITPLSIHTGSVRASNTIILRLNSNLNSPSISAITLGGHDLSRKQQSFCHLTHACQCQHCTLPRITLQCSSRPAQHAFSHISSQLGTVDLQCSRVPYFCSPRQGLKGVVRCLRTRHEHVYNLGAFDASDPHHRYSYSVGLYSRFFSR